MIEAQTTSVSSKNAARLSGRRRAVFILINCLLPLVLGVLIYIAWRAPTTGLSQAAHWEFLDTLFAAIRAGLQTHIARPPAWMLYALPDGLWAYALVALLGAIWVDAPGWPGRAWLFFAPFAAMSYELAQALGLAQGHFAIADLVVSLLAAFCAMLSVWGVLGRHR